MAALNKFNQFVENLAKGVHNFTSDATCTLRVALSNTLPTVTDALLSDITEISYTNISTREITGVTAEQTAGIVTLTATDLVLTASGTVPDFKYIIIYDDDPSSPLNPLIGWYTHSTTVSLTTAQTFTIDFVTGILTIT